MAVAVILHVFENGEGYSPDNHELVEVQYAEAGPEIPSYVMSVVAERGFDHKQL